MLRRIGALLLAAVIAVAGCRKGKSHQSKGARKAPTVEVITDAGEIETARKAWSERREQVVREALADPARIRGYERETMTLLKEHRQRAVQSLGALRDDPSQPAETRVHAIIALTLLGVPPDARRLADAARANEAATFELLVRIHELYPDAMQQLPTEIRPLVSAAIGSGEDRVAFVAADVAARYRLAEAIDPLLARVREKRKGSHDRILAAAARLRPEKGVVDQLVEQVARAKGFEISGPLSSLADAAEATPDPQLRRRIADALVAHLKARPDEPWTDSGTMSAVDVIGKTVDRDAAIELLFDVVRGARAANIRRMALRALNDLDPGAAKRVSTESGVAMPESEVEKVESPKVDVAKAAAACIRHHVLTQAEADAALAVIASRATTKRSEDEVYPDDVEGLFHAAGRYLAFDAETGMVPARHDELIDDIAAASAGRFVPEAALETYTTPSEESETGTYRVQFIHRGRLYRFAPEDLGDWYDVPAVLVAVDRALLDAQVKERPVALKSGGQDVALIFADPGALKAAAGELGLELEDDADRARREGKEFEDQVIQQMKER